ncbi:MAG TPA: flagellar biosynthesis protein FlhB [Tepidisphaeraceae bacterium]|jgi:flagellar biosynthetic protein FlhB|nr:flagellar biosynthesis protein FlhB [Tepidisphaeraceae bacterium]
MAESTGDKTEVPTPRRRQEAREQGNIARSHDLTSAVLLIGALYLMRWFGPKLILTLRDVVGQQLSAASMSNLNAQAAGEQVVHSLAKVSIALAPMLGGAVFIVIVANVAQVGFNFSPQRLAINFAALNPVRGWSKMFSFGQGGLQLIMNLLKVTLVGLLAWSALSGRLGQIISVQRLSFLQIFALGSDLVFSIGIRVGVLLLVLAILDYVYQRYHVEQQIRMTKQEVKDEMRNMEGDPLMKQRRKQIAVQRAMQKLKKDVPSADVVVTNPTHYAVALKYEESKMRAPRLVAKGVDFMAQRIRELAVEAGVPIIERPPLARAIYRMVDVGEEIPEEFYAVVAEILAYVYELTGKARRHVPA